MNSRTKALLAYAYIAIAWGTTYYGISVAVKYFPPFFMAGVRQFISAIIILIIALWRNRNINLSKQNLWRNAVIGFLMITVGNGVVSWAEKYIPSGVAALVCSMMPISAVILNLLFSKSERPNFIVFFGMILGFCGVAFIFHNDVHSLANTAYLFGVIATLLATFGWAGGSILSKKWSDAINPISDAGMQVGFGAIFLFLISPLTDDFSTAEWNHADGLLALAYLIIFGSVIAFTAYRYALKELPVGFVTSYAYINPLVAVVVGFFAGEVVTLWTLLSFLFIISGVVIVRAGYARQLKKSKHPGLHESPN